ncbi:SGNH/GDSL hydrolase family protein [Arthrobacter sp. SAFR-014]|uniref:SGNH/GDSL hydrolase family protein n=1 Tax=unclassified Arthrobacter TaxID=235627 RepID=UPI003F7C71CE
MSFLGALRGAKNRASRRYAIRSASKHAATGPMLTVLGDSFVAGEPHVPASETFPHKLAHSMGWTVRFADGQGGTGYVAPGGDGSAPYPVRIQDLAAVPADVLLISGGYNDTWNVVTGVKSISQVQAAIDSTLHAAPRVAPKVIVVGPFWTRPEETPAQAYAINDYVHGAALARGFRFVDVLTDNWVTLENRAGIISEDDTHPTAAGQDYIAARLAVVLADASLSARRYP